MLNEKLQNVVEALLDVAAEQYRQENIYSDNSLENICRYAELGMNLSINLEEAKLIQQECQKRLNESFDEKVKRSCEEMFNDRIK